jgi:hypothetical protein
MVEDKLGHHKPGGVGIDAMDGIGEKLADGVDAMGQDAGPGEELKRRDEGVDVGFGGDGAFVAIAEGLGDGGAIGVQADVVDTPGVDGDGSDAFWGCLCGLQKAFVEAGKDGIERPAKGRSSMDWAVRDAVDNFNDGFAGDPSEE